MPHVSLRGESAITSRCVPDDVSRTSVMQLNLAVVGRGGDTAKHRNLHP